MLKKTHFTDYNIINIANISNKYKTNETNFPKFKLFFFVRGILCEKSKYTNILKILHKQSSYYNGQYVLKQL